MSIHQVRLADMDGTDDVYTDCDCAIGTNHDADAMIPLGMQTGTPADHRITVAQLGGTRFLKTELRGNGFVHDDRRGLFMFCYGSSRARTDKIAIVLMASDTYSVERGYIDRKTYDYVVVAQETGIYADQLQESVRRLAATRPTR